MYDSSMSFHGLTAHFFLLLSHHPLSGRTTVYLPICQLRDAPGASSRSAFQYRSSGSSLSSSRRLWKRDGSVSVALGLLQPVSMEVTREWTQSQPSYVDPKSSQQDGEPRAELTGRDVSGWLGQGG